LLLLFGIFIVSGCKKELSNNKKTNSLAEGVTQISTIVYTDVNPDTTVKCFIQSATYLDSCSSIYFLDLNKDGINDFSIKYSARKAGIGNLLSSYNYNIPRINSNVIVTPLSGNAVYDTIKYQGNLIDGGLKWVTSIPPLASTINLFQRCSGNNSPMVLFCWGPVIISGNWSGQIDKYLPLKLNVGTNVYYGWARLDVAIGGTSFTIKEYAYNSKSNQGILAGQVK
jgi:hypothetical protein